MLLMAVIPAGIVNVSAETAPPKLQQTKVSFTRPALGVTDGDVLTVRMFCVLATAPSSNDTPAPIHSVNAQWPEVAVVVHENAPENAAVVVAFLVKIAATTVPPDAVAVVAREAVQVPSGAVSAEGAVDPPTSIKTIIKFPAVTLPVLVTVALVPDAIAALVWVAPIRLGFGMAW
jgi:hypothetical protein